MAHELDFTKGTAAIAYTGAVPWHGFGQPMEEDLPLERWLVAAGMNYRVNERPVVWNPYLTYEELENSPLDRSARSTNYLNFKPVKGRKILTRSDTNDVLSIVSDRYNVVQPKEILEFFRDLVKDLGFKIHTAGVLAGGNRVWALAEIGKDFKIPGTKDQLGGYFLLATSYDGKFSTTAQFTSIRVVCNNTLSWSLKSEEDSVGVVRIPHNVEFIPSDVKNQLGLLGDDGWEGFKNNVIKLSEVKVTKRQAVEFFLELLGVTEDEAAEGKQLISAKKLIAFYESGPGSDFVSAKNTTWGLVNAVTYFTDHGRRAHNNGTRFNSAAFGDGAKMKRDAMASALKIAEAA